MTPSPILPNFPPLILSFLLFPLDETKTCTSSPTSSSIPTHKLLEGIADNAGCNQVPPPLVAKPPPAQVAAGWTVAGVKIGPHVFQCRGLLGGMSAPPSGSFKEEVIDNMLLDERPLLARQVAIPECGGNPGACEWWLRRAATALPLALLLDSPLEEILLPANPFPAGICTLSVTAAHGTPIILDIDKNFAALAEMRGLAIDGCYGDSSQLKEFDRLTALPALKLIHAARLRNGSNPLPWPVLCNQVQYLFLEEL